MIQDWKVMPRGRSLLSSTDSCRNPAESGQFPEFCRNQIWQRGLPNSYNDSTGMVPGITWMECTGMESVPTTLTMPTPKSSIGVCRCLMPTLDLGVVNSPKLYFPSTTIIIHNDHPAHRIATLTNGHHHPRSSPTALSDHCRTQMQQRHTYATTLADTSHSK